MLGIQKGGMSTTYFIASDHAGIDLKHHLIEHLKTKTIFAQDLGPTTSASVDYPDYANLLCQKVLAEKNAFGILICGSGIGMSIAANRFSGIRAALVTSPWMAQMSKNHNNANVLCLGSRALEKNEAQIILDAWIESSFEGGRHEKRVQKLFLHGEK